MSAGLPPTSKSFIKSNWMADEQKVSLDLRASCSSGRLTYCPWMSPQTERNPLRQHQRGVDRPTIVLTSDRGVDLEEIRLVRQNLARPEGRRQAEATDQLFHVHLAAEDRRRPLESATMPHRGVLLPAARSDFDGRFSPPRGGRLKTRPVVDAHQRCLRLSVNLLRVSRRTHLERMKSACSSVSRPSR